jgi:hypothetical protein
MLITHAAKALRSLFQRVAVMTGNAGTRMIFLYTGDYYTWVKTNKNSNMAKNILQVISVNVRTRSQVVY